MRKHLVSAIGVALLLVACGAQPTCGTNPAATSSPAAARLACGDANAIHRAYVVVQHMSGAWLAACVGFTTASLNGASLMNESGIQYRMQTRVVCQVDREPALVGACLGANQPRWALFVFSLGRWSQPGTDLASLEIGDREAIGLHYVPTGVTDLTPPPPPPDSGS